MERQPHRIFFIIKIAFKWLLQTNWSWWCCRVLAPDKLMLLKKRDRGRSEPLATIRMYLCVRGAFEVVMGDGIKYDDRSKSTQYISCSITHNSCWGWVRRSRIRWSISFRLAPSPTDFYRCAKRLSASLSSVPISPVPLSLSLSRAFFSCIPASQGFSAIYLRPFNSLQCNFSQIHHTIIISPMQLHSNCL